jgi:hypothetical protein
MKEIFRKEFTKFSILIILVAGICIIFIAFVTKIETDRLVDSLDKINTGIENISERINESNIVMDFEELE